ncbi:hypothetical protein BJ742DRAFT_262260 [Cladochytrium replicatum]|nr:hypothetical protein BJ742DRAFT_262260 [Cladochytrium replicatum]
MDELTAGLAAAAEESVASTHPRAPSHSSHSDAPSSSAPQASPQAPRLRLHLFQATHASSPAQKQRRSDPPLTPLLTPLRPRETSTGHLQTVLLRLCAAIDPRHASVTRNILKELELPLEKRPGFVDLRGNVFYQMLKLGQSLAGAAVETRSPTNGTSRKASRSPEHEAPKMRFQLPIPRDAAAAPRDEEEEDEEEEEVMISLSLVRKLGEGGFATVYLVEKVPIGLLEDEEDDEYGKPCRQENSSGERELVALKMQSVSDGRWEFYILSELIERLAHPEGANEEISAMLRRATESMVQCDALHLSASVAHVVLFGRYMVVEEERKVGTGADGEGCGAQEEVLADGDVEGTV